MRGFSGRKPATTSTRKRPFKHFLFSCTYFHTCLLWSMTRTNTNPSARPKPPSAGLDRVSGQHARHFPTTNTRLETCLFFFAFRPVGGGNDGGYSHKLRTTETGRVGRQVATCIQRRRFERQKARENGHHYHPDGTGRTSGLASRLSFPLFFSLSCFNGNVYLILMRIFPVPGMAAHMTFSFSSCSFRWLRRRKSTNHFSYTTNSTRQTISNP